MTNTQMGIFVGAILAVVAVKLGFWAFILTALFMVIGSVLCRATTGKLDLRAVGSALIGKHTTTSD